MIGKVVKDHERPGTVLVRSDSPRSGVDSIGSHGHDDIPTCPNAQCTLGPQQPIEK